MQHFLHKMCNKEASRCSRAKQRQGNVQKRVKHVQSCYLLTRPIVSFLFVCLFFAVHLALAIKHRIVFFVESTIIKYINKSSAFSLS